MAFSTVNLDRTETGTFRSIGPKLTLELETGDFSQLGQRFGASIFLDMDSALREHPEIVKRHFGTIIPPADNKFAALNTSVWSGGSFTSPAGRVYWGLCP